MAAKENEVLQESLDLASQSLADALDKSFKILQILMWVLVILYLGSGIYQVENHEVAMVLRFGQVVGTKADRIKKPGAHWTWPYPISRIVKIPFRRIQWLELNDFWYYEEDQNVKKLRQRIPKTLDPVRDGYCLTGDFNLLHSRWALRYRISDPYLYFTSQKQPRKMLANMLANSIIKVMATFEVDVAHRTGVDLLRQAVESELRQRLAPQGANHLNMGVEIKGVELRMIIPPRQTREAFESVVQAEQEKSQKIEAAKSERKKIVNQARGEAARILQAARTFKNQIIQEAEADAAYFKKIIARFEQNPEVFITRQYQDTLEQVLQQVREIIILRQDNPQRELRILLNRDPAQYQHAAEEAK